MLKPLGSFLHDAVERSSQVPIIDTGVILENAGVIIRQVMPELMPSDFQVVSYVDGVLTITMVDPVIGEALHQQSEYILAALQDSFPHLVQVRYIPRVEQRRTYRQP